MEEAIAKADKGVLADIVKFSQKNGLKGSKGGWKEFLESHDKNFGAGLSDPAKRSADVLIAFLQTFTKKDCKFLCKLIMRRSDRAEMGRFIKEFPDQETPEQRLVQLTVEHPRYTQRYSFPSHDESVLGYKIRKEGEPHNCLTASTSCNEVPESDLRKLLIHKVPVEVPCQELRGVFSMEYDIDVQADLRVRGQYYSTFAIFKDAGDAYSAFRGIEGQETMDSGGRLQKNVMFTPNTGRTFTFYVRRMIAGGLLSTIEFPKKRIAVGDDTQYQKRQRMSPLRCCNHVEEIEKLAQELRDREDCGKENEKLKQELRDREGSVKEIEKLMQDLHEREDEIFKLQKVVASYEEK